MTPSNKKLILLFSLVIKVILFSDPKHIVMLVKLCADRSGYRRRAVEQYPESKPAENLLWKIASGACSTVIIIGVDREFPPEHNMYLLHHLQKRAGPLSTTT